MSFWKLILRNLRYHARAHIVVMLGAAIGSAALVGALVVGDSVSFGLREIAFMRIGRVNSAMPSNDKLFRSRLAAEMSGDAKDGAEFAAVLQLPGVAALPDGSARANQVQVLGVDREFWKLARQPPDFAVFPPDSLAINAALAAQLRVKTGDTVVLRVQKPSLLSRDAPVSPQDKSFVALSMPVCAVVSDEQFGRFGLRASQIPPFNAYVNLARLQAAVEQTGKANLLLTSLDAADAGKALINHWQLEDAGLTVRELPGSAGFEIKSSRVFIDPPVVDAALGIFSNARPVLTYFVNELRSADRSTPYSMVTGMGAPIVPADMRDDEILVNDWLADDLNLKPGDTLSLAYSVIGNGRALEERRQGFHVREVIPLAGAAADPGFMPDFPGIADAETSGDWDAGMPLHKDRIRPKDELYWKQHRGTPKAFVTLNAGRKMWSTRFGNTTALRFESPGATLETVSNALARAIQPGTIGLAFEPVRDEALAASSQAIPFGGLFIGFSFFLIVAALLLMGLLFQFGLEQRSREIGTMLALGFRPGQVRRILLGEGILISLCGGILGAAGGAFYAKAMLAGLGTIWRGAVGITTLPFHATAQSILTGLFSATIMAVLTIWLTLRKQAGQPARELLADGAAEKIPVQINGWKRHRAAITGWLCLLLAAGLFAYAMTTPANATPDNFFSAGSLMLIAALAFSSVCLSKMPTTGIFTISGLAIRGCGRRPRRSLATIGLLACGVFLIVAIGVFRIDARPDAWLRLSGTGGFALIGESSFPVTYDLNSAEGRNFYGLNQPFMSAVKVVSFRAHDGDEASCLNLNRAQQPRLLGVNPAELQKRNAFTFSQALKGATNGWDLLSSADADAVPAIADANSIQWAMQKQLGDTIDYTDARGHAFKVRLVGALENSVLQGNLIIDEAEFTKRFPDESGYRIFLVDAPSNAVAETSAGLSKALRDSGMELTPAADRLNQFNAVQNTYLNTFQVLGGLGLLLGSAGLGVVVMRNLQERRGEMALMLALGFRRGALNRMALGEHAALLGMGLLAGGFAAVTAVAPVVIASHARPPVLPLLLTCGAVWLNGILWTWIAARFALRGRLLDSLRNE
jgi:ABC-type antimicrobial peptide transport system permease subunit